jgi:LPXTG-site transpeptidase (sortase) family protein
MATERGGKHLAAPWPSRRTITGTIFLTITLFASSLVGTNLVAAEIRTASESRLLSNTQKIPSVRIAAPDRLRIPTLGVNSPMMRLGLQGDRSLQVPPNGYSSGWYAGGPRPGQIGPAVIAAHVHWDGRWAVFQHLAKLKYGDRIIVDRSDGSAAYFRVTRVARFKKTKFPTNLVYGNIGNAGLRLITCDRFNAARRAYMDNVVVFAVLVSPRPLGL